MLSIGCMHATQSYRLHYSHASHYQEGQGPLEKRMSQAAAQLPAVPPGKKLDIGSGLKSRHFFAFNFRSFFDAKKRVLGLRAHYPSLGNCGGLFLQDFTPLLRLLHPQLFVSIYQLVDVSILLKYRDNHDQLVVSRNTY